MAHHQIQKSDMQDHGEAKVTRMKELVSLLNQAARAYYQEDREIMSNLEYDGLYDELSALEKETGIILSGSPTVRVGYEVLSELPKVAHASPMLSLDKTKDPEDLKAWLGDQKGMLSWRLAWKYQASGGTSYFAYTQPPGASCRKG